MQLLSSRCWNGLFVVTQIFTNSHVVQHSKRRQLLACQLLYLRWNSRYRNIDYDHISNYLEYRRVLAWLLHYPEWNIPKKSQRGHACGLRLAPK